MLIFINDLAKITDTKYSIGFQHNMPFDEINGLKKTEEQLLQEGKLVELPSKLQEAEGKIQAMYYNPTTNACFWEYIDIPAPQPTQEEILSQTVANLTLQNADLQNQLQTLSQTIAQMQLG